MFSHEGTINWFAFIAQLREPLTLSRGKALDVIWRSLDSTGAGKVQVHYSELSKIWAMQVLDSTRRDSSSSSWALSRSRRFCRS